MSQHASSQQRRTADTSASECARYGPGEGVGELRPGDLVLIRGATPLGLAIRWFERLRYRKPQERHLAHWSHAALVLSPSGLLVEVTGRGVVLSRIEQYCEDEYHYIRLDLSDEQRRNVTRYAYSCCGQKYGTRSFLYLVLFVLLGGRFSAPDRGEHGCVALIARALQKAGMEFDRAPADMMPGDLAKKFDVRP